MTNDWPYMDSSNLQAQGVDYFYSLGIQYPISQSVLVVISLTAIFTKSEKFHSIFVLAALAYMVFSGFSFYETVG